MTTCKPLKSILTKPLSKVPPRVQRLLLRLQRYDLQVEYTPGTEIPVADTLSRAYLTNHQELEIPETSPVTYTRRYTAYQSLMPS